MKKKKRIIEGLRNKYRLVIMNESTFEEKVSLILSKLNVFMVISSLVVFFTGLIYLVLATTPMKEYIPGCIDRDQTRALIDLAIKVDSLDRVIGANGDKINNDLSILTDHPDTSTKAGQKKDSFEGNVHLDPSKEEVDLRNAVKPKEDYSVQANSPKTSAMKAPFFSPLKGKVSAKFDASQGHLAVDVVGQADETVKAVLEGTVILSNWTPETGHVLAIQHRDNLISIYKHNAVLLKKVGNFVDAGEAIAIIGNSGENSTGPHLHFELWHNGVALNAEDYIVFK